MAVIMGLIKTAEMTRILRVPLPALAEVGLEGPEEAAAGLRRLHRRTLDRLINGDWPGR